MTKMQQELLDKIDAFMDDECGISVYCVVFHDPDTDASMCKHRGDRDALIGMMSIEIDYLKREVIREIDREEEG